MHVYIPVIEAGIEVRRFRTVRLIAVQVLAAVVQRAPLSAVVNRILQHHAEHKSFVQPNVKDTQYGVCVPLLSKIRNVQSTSYKKAIQCTVSPRMNVCSGQYSYILTVDLALLAGW